ncbi:MAG: lipase family protein, partial [Flavobacterium sp.]
IFTSDGQHYTIDTYFIVYSTLDALGNPTVASGAMMVPVNTPCTTFPIVSFAHGTVLRKDEVPSQNYANNLEGYFLSSKGSVVVMPDYIGLGISPGFHPYLHAQSEATATLDMIRAAREFFALSGTMSLDGKVFITGYSQGGHAAMATLKYIQDQNLTSEFNIAAGGPMSGPYALSTEEIRILNNNFSNNGYIPYIINSYQNIYGNLYSSLDAYYKSPFHQTIPPYLDGTHSLVELNSILPLNANGFLQDSVLANLWADSINFSHPLRNDLRLNDNDNWKPMMPIRMCYCGADDVVLPANTKKAYANMIAKG